MEITYFAFNRFVQGFATLYFEFCPGDDRVIMQSTVNNYPGVFLQNQVKVFEFWNTEANLFTQLFKCNQDMAVVIGINICVTHTKSWDFIMSGIKEDINCP